MAEDNDKLLTDEELTAIEEMVASGDLGGEGYNVGVASDAYDLTLQDTSVGVNVTAIEQINDRFQLWVAMLYSVTQALSNCSRHRRSANLKAPL